MENKGLAAVVTGEGPSLNEPPWLPPTSILVVPPRSAGSLMRFRRWRAIFRSQWSTSKLILY